MVNIYALIQKLRKLTENCKEFHNSPCDTLRNCLCPVERERLYRAGDSGGSSRFLGLPLRAEIRIPAPEGVLPLFVEHTGSYLQEKMCSTLTPPHLLSLHHPFAYDLIDRRLDETGSDLFPVAIAFPVMTLFKSFRAFSSLLSKAAASKSRFPLHCGERFRYE